MRYPWQDETRAFESPEFPAPDFRFKRLEGVHMSVVVPPVRREVPLYMRLDPDRWPLTICVLAALLGEAPPWSAAIWLENFHDTNAWAISNGLDIPVDDVEDM